MSTNPFDALSEMQRLEINAAMQNPAMKELLLLSTLVRVRDDVSEVKVEARAARGYCHNKCLPETDKRLKRLERFVSRLVGIGITLLALSGLIFAIWEALQKV